MFDLLLIAFMAIACLFYGIKQLRKRTRLLRSGHTVQAQVVSSGEGQKGRFLVLEFSVNDTKHHLQYPMPNKGSLPTGTLTLHYDPSNPENLLVEEDKADLYGIWFCLILGVVLTALAVYIALL